MTLGLYLVRRLLKMLGLVALVLFSVIYLVEFVESLRSFSGSDATMGQVALLAALRAPTELYVNLPLVMVIASMLYFMGIARSSELVVIRAAGRSGLRLLLEPILAVLLLGILAVALLNPLVAMTTRLHQTQASIVQDRGSGLRFTVAGGEIWLRQGDPDGQTVIRASHVGDEGLRFQDVTFLRFERVSGRPLSRIEAREARLDDRVWILEEAREWPLGVPNPEVEMRSHERMRLPTDLTPERLRDSFARSGAVSVWALPELIAALDQAGLSSRAQRSALMRELSLPLMLVAMLMIGAMLTMRHARVAQTAQAFLITVLSGFGVFMAGNFALVLGENGLIPLWLAVLSPPIASILLATGLLLHQEDG